MRAIRARRRWFAAVLAAAAVAFALDALAPEPPASARVVVASGDLAPGAHLESADLRLVAWPTALVPPGALTSLEAAAGRTLASAVGEGEALTALRFVGPALATTLRTDGRIAAPVRLADAQAATLLRPGDRLDLVAASAGGADPIDGTAGGSYARVVAAGAVVITVPSVDRGRSVIAGSPSSGGALVVVAVTRTEALMLAEAAVLGPISALLVG